MGHSCFENMAAKKSKGGDPPIIYTTAISENRNKIRSLISNYRVKRAQEW